jgi:hypothetical protein
MTIEFFKKKKMIQAQRRDMINSVPPKNRKHFRKHLRVVRVKVVDSGLLDRAGGRKYGGEGFIKNGEIGYVFSWRGMRKDAGLSKARR